MLKPRRGVEIVAHRGACQDAPEHTFEAYDLALKQGADRIELDVRRTASGDLVVHHDATLARTAGDDRAVGELTRADLDGLEPAARPLALDDVLARYGGDTRWLVDLKDPDEHLEAGVARALARHGVGAGAVVQAFDHTALARMKTAEPWLAVAPLYRRSHAFRSRFASLAEWAGGITVNRSAVTPRLVGRARLHGLALRVWTVNDPAEARRLVALGVDGLITDVPALIRDAVSFGEPMLLTAGAPG